MAYQIAASNAGVPPSVLYAIALQESGVRLRGRTIPWPWTLNVAGTPFYYATRDSACLGLLRALEQQPATRVDAGLAQLNLGYQQRFYQQPCDVLDPYRNLAIAAAILQGHRRSGEDWIPAIGRYHRPAGGEPAARYQRYVNSHLQRLAR
jgi:soluble lytic murein transglycosylase-like protein